jgi:hypothetical protein
VATSMQKALGWSDKMWRFSIYTHRVNEARNFVHKVFKAAQKDPQDFDFRSFVQHLTKPDQNPAPKIYTVERMMEDYLQNLKPSDCETCNKKYYPSTLIWIKSERAKCEDCEHRKQKMTYNTVKTSVRHIFSYLGI